MLRKNLSNPSSLSLLKSCPSSYNLLYRKQNIMQGGIVGGGYADSFPSKANIVCPGPPISAIDRFLVGNQSNNFSFQADNHQNTVKFKDGKLLPSGLSCFSSDNGYGNVFSSSRVAWPSFQDGSAVDGIGLGAEILGCTQEKNPNMRLKEEVKLNRKIFKGGKRARKGSSSTLIKGQWTEEEDRKLIKLVKQYGVRKWAQIAENLGARAGKQCRERWNNHLRPNIKKDSWTEEEERMLVEAHEQLGNRWSEIARRIPGRTENSIKNHWNATKRRQNSRRKNKQAEKGNGKKPQPSILQDYIRTKNLTNNNASNPTLISTTMATPTISNTISITPSSSVHSEDPTSQITNFLMPTEQSESNPDHEESQSLIANQYDDELLFMQKFFADDSMEQSLDINAENMENNNSPVMEEQHLNKEAEEKIPNTLSSDLFLSYLLHGGEPSSESSSIEINYENMDIELEPDQTYNSERKEMDLIEMVYSKLSQGTDSML